MSKTLEQRVIELEEKVKELEKNKQIRFSKLLGVGDTFKLLGLEWTILEISNGSYKCLAERLEKSMEFDSDCNNWSVSDLRNYLNTDFYKELANAVGEENIIPIERDLLSLDGQTEYRTCEDKVSLLTVDEYRKNRKFIPNTDDYWWWLITPHSTKCNDDSTWISVVSPSGYINVGRYDSVDGVRPFVSFSSAIFESEEWVNVRE